MSDSHTTHFDDCGCKSTEYEAKLAHMQERLDEAERVVDECKGFTNLTAGKLASRYRERFPKAVDDGREIQGASRGINQEEDTANDS